ncbi:hypothetical protein MMC29_005872, partial [Sticta canariensis]|nr:hypothetical protein [Sticta canariensis]
MAHWYLRTSSTKSDATEMKWQMAPQVLYRVCFGTPNPPLFQRSSLTITPALLLGYACHKVRFCDYPAIIPSSSTSSVHGTYVSGLTDGDIWRLDIFEGDQYVRKKLKIKTLTKLRDGTGEGNVEGGEVEVETYVWIAGDELLEEGEWDFDEFTREKLKSWVGNEQYEEVDEAVKAGAVDPTGGRGAKGQIANQLDSILTEDMLKSAV